MSALKSCIEYVEYEHGNGDQPQDVTDARAELDRLLRIERLARSLAVTYDVINGTVATPAIRALLEVFAK